MHNNGVRVLHAVTDPISMILMRGQSAYLKAAGFEPILLSSPGQQLERAGIEEGCSVYSVEMKREISPGHDLVSLFKLWRVLRRIRPVICNSGTPKAGLLVGLAAWMTRVPCRVYTLRGLRLETATGAKRKLLTIAEKTACRCAHRVICVSPSLRERVVSLGLVPAHKTTLLGAGSSNGIDVARFALTPEKVSAAAALRKDMGIRPEQTVVGYVGRFTKDKGLPELVSAFLLIRETMPDAILLLVGDYEAGDPVTEDVQQIIRSTPGIHCTGFTSQVDLYYLMMSLFVLPTHREGFPNTVLEAQVSGLPVITTRATGAMDAIVDEVTGLLVPVGEPKKLAQAILSLLTNPARMQRMGNAGRERVHLQFRKEVVWRELEMFYRAMLQQKGYPHA